MNREDKERNGKRRNAGFTLIEIMIVVTILGMLATLVTIEAPSIMNKQRRKVAAQNIKRLQNAIDMYETETGKYPQTLNDLVNVKDKNGVKFVKNVPKDPWGHDFVYKVPGMHNEEYSISSLGADGAEGGDGKNMDINSWDNEEEEKK